MSITTTTTSRFHVTRSAGVFVVPCEPTPSHTLVLTHLDTIDMPSSVFKIYWVYKQSQAKPAPKPDAIRLALTKALVPYYPIAGRFVRSSSSNKLELQVACTAEGLWFVEASANCSLEQVGWLYQPTPGMEESQLFPSDPHPADMPAMIQVTRFTCGGLVVGLAIDHIIVDGVGAGQFMNAFAEISRGLERPTIEPIWHREHFPAPSSHKKNRPTNIPTMPQFEFLIVDVPQDQIEQLKQLFLDLTGEKCSTHDIALAKLWQCRTRAIGHESGGVDLVHLVFIVNARKLLSHKLLCGGIGYYGNCTHPLLVSAPRDFIAHGSISEIVVLIRDAKKRLPDEFCPTAPPPDDAAAASELTLGYASVGVSDWRRNGFDEVDYGWGRPAYFAMSGIVRYYLGLPPWCVIVNRPSLERGCRLLTACVKEEHLQAFHDEFHSA